MTGPRKVRKAVGIGEAIETLTGFTAKCSNYNQLVMEETSFVQVLESDRERLSLMEAQLESLQWTLSWFQGYDLADEEVSW